MTTSPPALALTYLGGCPGHTRPEPVSVTVYDDRFEVQAKGWGWRIGFDSVLRVGDAQPSPDGQGQMVPIAWAPPSGGEPTLLLSGTDAVRLRFLLAQSVATSRLAAEMPVPEPPARDVLPRRGGGAWHRELRRMRAVTVAAMTVALAALVLVFGVTLVVLEREAAGGHWATDRATLGRLNDDIRGAVERNDAGAQSAALQALVDECQRLTQYNDDPKNTGSNFEQAQRTCADAGVVLF
jgi:hypothetical protein